MTSIDFQQMLKEERRKAMVELKQNRPQKVSHRIFSDRPSHENINLEPFKLQSAPINSIYYIPDYISESEESKLVEAIYKEDEQCLYGEKKSWVSMSKRRLKNLGGGKFLYLK